MFKNRILFRFEVMKIENINIGDFVYYKYNDSICGIVKDIEDYIDDDGYDEEGKSIIRRIKYCTLIFENKDLIIRYDDLILKKRK